jgi:hypothetical protein
VHHVSLAADLPEQPDSVAIDRFLAGAYEQRWRDEAQ